MDGYWRLVVPLAKQTANWWFMFFGIDKNFRVCSGLFVKSLRNDAHAKDVFAYVTTTIGEV